VQDRGIAAQPAERGDEVREALLAGGAGPVDPADRVVLAVGVVVAALGAAELVAAEQQRGAFGEQEGGEEVAALAGAQLEDGRGVGRAFGAAVPAAVVVVAVASSPLVSLCLAS